MIGSFLYMFARVVMVDGGYDFEIKSYCMVIMRS